MQLTETKRRLPWLAALLSLLTPGLGQLYCRRPKRALAWFLISAVVGTIFYVLLSQAILVPTLPVQWAFYLGLGVYEVALLADAWMLASRVGSITLTWYTRWYVYLLIFAVLQIVGYALIPEKPAYQTFSMPSASMSPTLVVGDMFAVSTSAYRFSPPQPGDVVVVKKAEGGRSFVKRVIGVAGDRVQMKEGRLYINGAMVERKELGSFTDPSNGTGTATLTQYQETLPNGRSYRIVELSDTAFFDNTPEFLVPSGELFLLGDNRDSSMDSRAIGEFGFIPLANVIGRVQFISGSLDPTRIGMKVE